MEGEGGREREIEREREREREKNQEKKASHENSTLKLNYTPGKFSQSTSMGVDLFVSPIFWYLSLSVSAFSPCQGRLPRRKYMNM